MTRQFPHWIKKRLLYSDAAWRVEDLINRFGLNTVCKSACCPNKNECFSQKKATFMILGNVCTRDCKFCAIKKGQPLQVDRDEPKRLSQAVEALGLNHVIITSVTRDDLEDGGAGQFREMTLQIKSRCPNITVEILTSDFKADGKSIDKVLDSPIDIFGHNVETVPRLYNTVRPQADYKRSLNVLKRAKTKMAAIKSGIMVGLGETKDEVFGVMRNLRDVGCELLTIGQYLQPTSRQLHVYEFIHPEVFESYKDYGLCLGFKKILSSPFARSSYMY